MTDASHTDSTPADATNAWDAHAPGAGDEQAHPARTLVLLGGGHAHVQVLQHLAKHPVAGARVTLVTPHTRLLYSGMVTGFAAGHFALDECAIALEPLARRAGVHWLRRSVKVLDADQRTVLLDDGSSLHYDWLSINTGSVQNRARVENSLPGARAHGLFVRPVDAFAALWPKVVELGSKKPLRIAVLGAGAAGLELAMAARQRLPSAAITLITGPAPLASQWPAPMQRALTQALKRRNITVLHDTALSLDAQAVHLGCGAALACDVPILAMGSQAPPWLMQSGLALDEHGFVAVDQRQQCINRPEVFAAGDVSTRSDLALEHSGASAAQAGPVLAANLVATIEGRALISHKPTQQSTLLLACGDRFALGRWKGFWFQGRWVWWLKRWMDRRFVGRFQ
jgi:NADH dehydrogenase FAD-containing subunit